ncbi:uncharacterized protein C11orf42 [Coregonus clupeaformis]|uniref:uncharacterized protein C11orf42 n=1 Tax=Coregonus clupeaformis TaxID=59861 RepID=UPI001BE1006F|nr:uncharacterized protein C11orf42 [Coregonus clupeaformis]XP_041699625.1 uncharacterized protein C11orf42 [Coregonus clupeaformis]
MARNNSQPSMACSSIGRPYISFLDMDKADDIWQCVKNKVASSLCGPHVTAMPHLRDAQMFRPLCVIGKRVERSLRVRKVRSLFPLGPLKDLLDDPAGSPEASLKTEGLVRCDFLHDEFLDGVGRVRVQVSNLRKEAAVCPLAPHRQLSLRDNLPWLDSVHRLYLVSEVYCSSDAKLRVLGMERRTELRLGPDTPLAFSCLRLSVSPSGLLEVCDGWEGSYLHPKARWAKFDSPDYASLVAGRPVSEPKMMSLLSQFAFNISHPSIISLPNSALHLPGPSPSKEQHQEAQEISSEALLPLDEEEEEGS